MRQTDQYARWQLIRQNTDIEAGRIAELVLTREALLKLHHQEVALDWQHFNQLTEELRQAGIALPTATDIKGGQAGVTAVSIQATTPPRSILPAGALLNDEYLLILSLICREVGLNQTIIAYGDGEKTLLPLGDIAQALDLALDVDVEQGTVSGWFISEDRTFSVDTGRQTIRIEGQNYPWDDGLIAVGDDDIYLDAQVLSRWLPLDVSISYGALTATMIPREKLPLQARYERELLRQRLGEHTDSGLKFDLIPSPYAMYSFPVMDFNLSGRFNNGNNYQLTHSMVAEGDLAHMGAQLFLTGSDQSPLDTARIRLERKDLEGQLLGPMQASQVTMGDLSPVALPLLGSSGSGIGVAISNSDIHASQDFDTTRFEGNMQPGWDVELYRNDILIDSIRVGQDGRYLFEDVPINVGTNAFQVVAHGPQGQQRVVESKNLRIGGGMLPPGDFNYSLSATRNNTSVFGLDQQQLNTDEKGRLAGRFNYGLTERLSANAGFAGIDVGQSIQNYLQAGLTGTISSFYGAFNGILDSEGGSGLALQGQTSLGPFNLRASHEIFSDFIIPDRPTSNLKARTSYGISGGIPQLSFLRPVSYSLSRIENTFDDRQTGRTSARLSGRLHNISLTNTTNWYDSTAGSLAPIDGQFQASGRLGKGRLTAAMQYELGKEDPTSRYRLSAIHPFGRDITAGADLVHTTGKIETTEAALNMSYDTGKVILSPQLTYNSEGDYGAFLSLSFSLGRDPISNKMQVQSERRTGTGMATAFVYHDANNNGIFDEGDTPLPEVQVIAAQAAARATTDEQGLALLSNLQAFAPTDVQLNPRTLEDPFWQPASPGVAMMARSGTIQALEFPIVSTGEIDGSLYYQDSDGNRIPLSRVRLELRDEAGELIQTTASEFDGFYLFEQVFPGTYTLHVRSEDPRISYLAEELRQEIVIGSEGTIAGGNDIIFLAPPADPPGNDAVIPPSSLKHPADNSETEDTTAPTVAATQPNRSARLDIRPLRVIEPSPTTVAIQPLKVVTAPAPAINIQPLQTVARADVQPGQQTEKQNLQTPKASTPPTTNPTNSTRGSLTGPITAPVPIPTSERGTLTTTPAPATSGQLTLNAGNPSAPGDNQTETATVTGTDPGSYSNAGTAQLSQNRQNIFRPIDHPVIQPFAPIEELVNAPPQWTRTTGYAVGTLGRPILNAAGVAGRYAAMQRRQK
ncbi:stalk domain-containing protein [Desulfobulbus alkaliphilus]|uniref:stalk domain-containing protein n=1 Tax=Desulfobulbus alkaliphilus TaxID=869814 RepID=UPI00196438D9|nr:stalk domain-containing protein [Desulfobulbus alkaliphilus]MBM9537092.1 hypothetical protein [Desulfobulbus alkaliphilus]